MKSLCPVHSRFISQGQPLIFKLGITYHYGTECPVIRWQIQGFKQRGVRLDGRVKIAAPAGPQPQRRSK